jgi:hypothetical protein
MRDIGTRVVARCARGVRLVRTGAVPPTGGRSHSSVGSNAMGQDRADNVNSILPQYVPCQKRKVAVLLRADTVPPSEMGKAPSPWLQGSQSPWRMPKA